MRKRGDYVTCKTFPKKVNGLEKDSDSNIIINKTYMVIDVSHQVVDKNGLTGLEMLSIIGENGKCYYWSDYFYNIKELRKLKLEKINDKRR
jgi:hypothetical protein